MNGRRAALTLLIACTSWSSAAKAAGERVLVLPTRAFIESDPGRAQTVDAALAKGAGVRPDLRALHAKDLRAAILRTKTYEDRLALARELAEEGVSSYERMRLEDAIRRLEKAAALFEATQHRWIGPEELAEVRLTLALAHLEAGRRDKAHLTFKALLEVQPARALAKGYYSPGAIQAFQVAKADFETAPDHSLRPTAVARLGRLVGARYVLEAHLRRRARGGVALVASLYDAKTRRLLDRESAPAAKRTLRWQTERLVSRLLACASAHDEREAAEDPFPSGRWRLGATVAGETFFLRPARERFVNAGLTVRADYLVRPHLVAIARSSFSTTTGARLSVQDYEDLRSNQDTARLLLGIGPRLGGGRLSAYVAAGLEALAPSSVRHTQDPGCKWGPGYACRSQRHDPGIVFGPGLAAGVAWRLLGPVYALAEISGAWYVFSAGDNELNAPLRVDGGFGYSF